MSEAFDQVCKLLPKLSRGELQQVRARAGALGFLGANNASRQAPATANNALEIFEDVVLDEVVAYLQKLGIEYSSPRMLRGMGGYGKFREKLPASKVYFDNITTNRVELRGVIRLAVGLLYKDFARINVSAGPRTLLNHWHRVPSVMNRSFPGYAAMGALHLIAGRAEVWLHIPNARGLIMFGTNAITKAFPEEALESGYLVNEVFYTLQGEGPDAGCPAIFIRLAKCNLRCFFCDTEFERGSRFLLHELVEHVRTIAEHAWRSRPIVVITGGEPLLQNIVPLVTSLNKWGFTCTVETAGTVWLDGLENLFQLARNFAPCRNAIICSPKTGSVHPKLEPIIHAYKYILNAGETSTEDGLPNASTQVQGKLLPVARPASVAEVFVQAMDVGNEEGNQQNLALASSVAMQFGYRLSVQMHKLAQLP